MTVFTSRLAVMPALHENASRLEHSHLTAVFLLGIRLSISILYDLESTLLTVGDLHNGGSNSCS